MTGPKLLLAISVLLIGLGLVQAVLGYESLASGEVTSFRYLAMLAPMLIGVGLLLISRQVQSNGGDQ